MTACAFLFPGALDTRTGGYLYDRHIVEGLRARRWTVALHSLGDGYPWPDDAARAQAAQVVQGLPDGTLAVVDGLGLGVLDALAAQHAQRLRWVALVHHPLALETGLDPARQAQLAASERRALASARGVIVTSPATARTLAADYGVPTDRIAVVLPGTAPAPMAPGSAAGAPCALLCVATLTPRKAHALLLDALAPLRGLPWVLHCVGSATMDAACADALRAQITRLGLADRVIVHGEADAPALERHYARADVFVLPSLHEGYGMALAEALARGLPIVSTRAGAIADTVPEGAGLLVPPGDVPALRDALARVLTDAALRERLRAGARAARAQLPAWPDSSARFADALHRFAALPGPAGSVA